MAPYVSGTSDTSPVYMLYGVVVHVDIMNAAFSGHYVCYVKNFDNRWFKMDDVRVCLYHCYPSFFSFIVSFYAEVVC